MKSILHICLTVIGASIVLLASGCSTPSGPYMGSHVTLDKDAGGYQLYYNGEPYFIRGAGGRDHLDQLVAAGGNSIRTWGGDIEPAFLDELQRMGITVTAGFWMGHERHGFDYSDPVAVQEQLEAARSFVRKHKHHPAILMWAVGNEMEWHPGTNAAIYKAVNDVVRMIKKEDPHHPVTTVVSGTGEDNIKLEYLKAFCPDIDVLGINAYGGAQSIPNRLKLGGWEKPYMVTEYGPLGPWEAGSTAWGAEWENDTFTKAENYLSIHEDAIASQPGWCLGGYAFLWGHKQEVTPTWFSMFLPDGSRLNAVDHMTYAWTGKWPANQCPKITFMQCGLKGQYVAPGAEYDLRVTAEDPDGDELVYVAEIMNESGDKREGGDAEDVPEAFPDAIVQQQGSVFTLRTPSEPGPYRLFVYVYDGQGNATSINSPFYVR